MECIVDMSTDHLGTYSQELQHKIRSEGCTWYNGEIFQPHSMLSGK